MRKSKKIFDEAIINRGILFFAIAVCLLMIVLICFHSAVHNYFYNNWIELSKMIGTTTAGGILAYCIIWVAENKREQDRQESVALKERKNTNYLCTQALLSSQMTILSQIEELRFLEKFCRTIINFSIGNTTLGAIHLQHTDSHKKAEILSKLLQAEPEKFKELVNKTKHIPTKHMLHHIISLPYSLFGAHAFIHATSEVALYIHELSRCNRKYMKIVSFTERQNEIRDIIVMRPSKKNLHKDNTEENLETNLLLIVGMISMVYRLSEKIASYFITADATFNQTADYIKKLGLSVPLFREQDYLINI